MRCTVLVPKKLSLNCKHTDILPNKIVNSEHFRYFSIYNKLKILAYSKSPPSLSIVVKGLQDECASLSKWHLDLIKTLERTVVFRS